MKPSKENTMEQKQSVVSRIGRVVSWRIFTMGYWFGDFKDCSSHPDCFMCNRGDCSSADCELKNKK